MRIEWTIYLIILLIDQTIYVTRTQKKNILLIFVILIPVNSTITKINKMFIMCVTLIF